MNAVEAQEAAEVRSPVAVTPFYSCFGAEIGGFDPSRPVSAETASAIRDALLDHQLLLVRCGAAMQAEQFLEFVKIFGTPKRQVLKYKWHANLPEVSLLDSTFKTDGTTDKQAYRTDGWHTDDSYLEIPCHLTFLHSIEVPDRGGNTHFADLYSAYETLPAATKARIDGLKAVHMYDTPRASRRPATLSAEEAAAMPPVEQPLVRTHNETGRKALYINMNRIDHIVGLEPAESEALLEELYAHAKNPDFEYSHAWRPGDLLIWDNRCLIHRVDLDYPVGQTRRMYRCLLEGTRPI